MRKVYVLGSVTLVALIIACRAMADDIPASVPAKSSNIPASYDWTGLYFGGHVGYARGRANAGLQSPDVTEPGTSFGGLFGGVQLGYNYLLPSRFLLGVEADISLPNYLGANDVAWSGTTVRGDVTEKIDYIGSSVLSFGNTCVH